MNKMKVIVLKQFFNIILITDMSLPLSTRLGYLAKALVPFGTFALLLDELNLWFHENRIFVTAGILIIFVNMILGAVVHKMKNTFMWQLFFRKTLIMVTVVLLTYVVLELVLRVAGENFVVKAFRTVLQVSTLLYPGSKILKNVFVMSDGEHPPKWIMKKIYNFQKNGDLSVFLDNDIKTSQDED